METQVGKVENIYGKLLRMMFFAMNPFKKMVIETECNIHKSINEQSLMILKNDGYIDAYHFFSDYMHKLNEGVVWADQDFRSTGHFYSPRTGKGLRGSRNALSLAVEYYSAALKYWYEGDNDRAMFFLGASVHIVQDMTIPQHVNIRLLDNHRQYENFIKRTYINTPKFKTYSGGYYIGSIEEAVLCNARTALRIYSKLKRIKANSRRYYTISKFTLPLAQKTTAGCLLRFYKDVSR